jgi:hypothetical protein
MRPGIKNKSWQLTCPMWVHRGGFFCTIAVIFWSVVVACGQGSPPNALSEELRAHVQDARFGIVTSIRGLPLGVRSALQTLFGSQTLDIAEPGARFQVNERSVSTLPTRRMAAAACSYERCLVYYERGGVEHTWHVALFHWTPDETKFEWGGMAPGGLVTIDEVRRAVLSGAIKSPTGQW